MGQRAKQPATPLAIVVLLCFTAVLRMPHNPPVCLHDVTCMCDAGCCSHLPAGPLGPRMMAAVASAMVSNGLMPASVAAATSVATRGLAGMAAVAAAAAQHHHQQQQQQQQQQREQQLQQREQQQREREWEWELSGGAGGGGGGGGSSPFVPSAAVLAKAAAFVQAQRVLAEAQAKVQAQAQAQAKVLAQAQAQAQGAAEAQAQMAAATEVALSMQALRRRRMQEETAMLQAAGLGGSREDETLHAYKRRRSDCSAPHNNAEGSTQHATALPGVGGGATLALGGGGMSGAASSRVAALADARDFAHGELTAAAAAGIKMEIKTEPGGAAAAGTGRGGLGPLVLPNSTASVAGGSPSSVAAIIAGAGGSGSGLGASGSNSASPYVGQLRGGSSSGAGGGGGSCTNAEGGDGSGTIAAALQQLLQAKALAASARSGGPIAGAAAGGGGARAAAGGGGAGAAGSSGTGGSMGATAAMGAATLARVWGLLDTRLPRAQALSGRALAAAARSAPLPPSEAAATARLGALNTCLADVSNLLFFARDVAAADHASRVDDPVTRRTLLGCCQLLLAAGESLVDWHTAVAEAAESGRGEAAAAAVAGQVAPVAEAVRGRLAEALSPLMHLLR